VRIDPTKMANEKIKRFWCDVCDYSSYYRARLENHSKTVYLGKKDFKCDICVQAFSQKGSLKIHVNAVHKKLTRFSCDLCDFSSSSSRRNLERHSKAVHLGKKDQRSLENIASFDQYILLTPCKKFA
jgi:uncharacterized Zn-finger protein